MEFDLSEALEETSKIIEKKSTDVSFGKYSRIYLAPTGNVKGVFDHYGENQSILTVGAMGSYAYEAILHGAKKVDLFDINILQYFYCELVQLGIKNFSFEQFMENFTTYILGVRAASSYLLKDIDELLKKENSVVTEYFSKLLERYSRDEIIHSSLFNCLNGNREHLKKNCSYYNKEEFYALKKILLANEASLHYQICDIADIDQVFQNTYDLITFDNILQFYKSIEKLNDVSIVNQWIQNTVQNMLVSDGKIQVCYGHLYTALYMMELLGTLDPAYSYHNQLYALSREKAKSGIIPNLYSLSDSYSIDFIQESDTFDSFTKHCVLSYKRSR